MSSIKQNQIKKKSFSTLVPKPFILLLHRLLFLNFRSLCYWFLFVCPGLFHIILKSLIIIMIFMFLFCYHPILLQQIKIPNLLLSMPPKPFCPGQHIFLPLLCFFLFFSCHSSKIRINISQKISEA